MSIALADAGVRRSGAKASHQPQKSSSPPPRPGQHGTAKLPGPGARDARGSSSAAVRSGRIEELRHAYELNELKPELGRGAGRRSRRLLEENLGRRRGPARYWRRSPDPGGRLRQPCRSAGTWKTTDLRVALFRRGAAGEASTPAQQVELLRLRAAGGGQGDVGPVDIPIGGWRSAPMAPGTLFARSKLGAINADALKKDNLQIGPLTLTFRRVRLLYDPLEKCHSAETRKGQNHVALGTWLGIPVLLNAGSARSKVGRRPTAGAVLLRKQPRATFPSSVSGWGNDDYFTARAGGRRYSRAARVPEIAAHRANPHSLSQPSIRSAASSHTKGRQLLLVQSATSALLYRFRSDGRGFTWTGYGDDQPQGHWPDWHPPAGDARARREGCPKR